MHLILLRYGHNEGLDEVLDTISSVDENYHIRCIVVKALIESVDAKVCVEIFGARMIILELIINVEDYIVAVI